jgi:hypothetical protein
VTLAKIGTMEQAMTLSVSQPRFDTMLLALFAGIALLLAAGPSARMKSARAWLWERRSRT